VKHQSEERPDRRHDARALLAVPLPEQAAPEEDERGADRRGSERGAEDAAGDQDLERLVVRLLDEAVEAARLHRTERLAESAEARAGERVRAERLERRAPDLHAAIRAELARIGAQEPLPWAFPRDRGRERGRDREREPEPEDAAEPRALAPVLDREEDEERHRQERGEDAAARAAQPDRGRDRPPEEDGERDGKDPPLDAPGARLAVPPVPARPELVPEEPERHRERDLEVSGEVVRVDERAVQALERLGGGESVPDLHERGGEERDEEETPSRSRPREQRGADEEDRVREGQEDDSLRLRRREGDDGARRRAAIESEDVRGSAPDREALRRDEPEHATRQGRELEEPEHRDTAEARGGYPGLPERGPRAAREGGERAGAECEELQSEGFVLCHAPVGERHGESCYKEKDVRDDVEGVGGERLGRGLAERMKRFLHGLLVGSCLISLAAGAAGVDEFYLARLRAGRDAYRSKRFAEAADELRIASFGFLDHAPLLMEAVVRLALAQDAAGRKVDLATTLDRFLETERRLSLYAKATLEPDTRAEFEILLQSKLTPDQLRALPSLARLAESPGQQLDKLPPAQRKAAALELEKKDRGNPRWPLELARLAAADGDQKEVVRWTSRVLDLDADEADALELRARARLERKEYAEALADLKALPAERVKASPTLASDLFVCDTAAKDWPAARAALNAVPEEARARPDVAKALKGLPVERAPAAAADGRGAPKGEVTPATIAAARKLAEEGKAPEAAEQLRGLVARAPRDRELRKALLEASCLSKDWKTGAEQVALIEPFRDGEEVFMFYAAVSLYQTGAADAAKVLMARARPKIGSNPFVDHYARKILGTS
jgi:hypothetical protein